MSIALERFINSKSKLFFEPTRKSSKLQEKEKPIL